MKETENDYQNCIMGNFYSSECSGRHRTWEEFKKEHWGFSSNGTNWDDTYNFVFRVDIHTNKNIDTTNEIVYSKTSYELERITYSLELCVMLQRKGIYTHLFIDNITQNELNDEVKNWLTKRREYIEKLWKF